MRKTRSGSGTDLAGQGSQKQGQNVDPRTREVTLSGKMHMAPVPFDYCYNEEYRILSRIPRFRNEAVSAGADHKYESLLR